jgi:hypothetical protein
LKIAGYFAFYSTINEAFLRKMFMYNVNYFICGFLKPLKNSQRPSETRLLCICRTVFICSSSRWIQRLDEDRISGGKILHMFGLTAPKHDLGISMYKHTCTLRTNTISYTKEQFFYAN